MTKFEKDVKKVNRLLSGTATKDEYDEAMSLMRKKAEDDIEDAHKGAGDILLSAALGTALIIGIMLY